MEAVTFQVTPREPAENVLGEKQDGDAAERSLTIAVFEQALDWRIGLAVLGVFQAVLHRRGGWGEGEPIPTGEVPFWKPNKGSPPC